MSDSLFDLLGQQLRGPALSQIARQLGTDERAVEGAMPTAIGAVLGGLARNSSRSGGAEALAKALSRDHDGSILDQLSDLGAHPQAGAGEGILGHVFGGTRPAVEAGIGRGTGLDAGSASQLLKLVAPLVMGALGKAQRERGLDAGGLAGLLRGESESVARKAPEGLGALGSLLDADGDGQIADDVAKAGLGILGRLFGKR